MLDRFAIYGVPVLAGLVVAAVLLGPGRERPVTGARVRGVLVTSARHYAVRIEALRHHAERFYPVPAAALRFEVLRGERVIGSWSGASDERGVAEADGQVEADLGALVELRVMREGQVLCKGATQPRPELERLVWPELPTGGGRDPVEVAVVLPRSAAVPPFPETARVDVWVREPAGEGEPRDVAPQLRLSAEGGNVGRVAEPVQRRCSDEGCAFRWTVEVVPHALTVQLSAEVETTSGQRGRWEGLLPLAVGGLWLDPTAVRDGKLAVRSATPRGAAFVSLLGRSGRLWGTAIPLRTDERGFASGDQPLPPIASEALVAVLSSDPSEPVGATVAWPLRPEVGSLPSVRLEVLADGLPAAIAREKQRERAARRPAYGLILAAGFFELLYLYRRNRLEKLKLRRHMQRIADAASDTPGLPEDEAELDSAPGLPAAAVADEPGRVDVSELGADAADRTEAHAAAMTGDVGLLWLTVLAGGVALAFLALAAVAAWG